MKERKTYLLYLLTVILAFNYMDRVVLGLVLQDVKTDLHLTDSQLGFLSGIAFALFYSILGVPLARWADRGNCVALISLSAAVWSIAVALCGAAHSFAHLMLIRIVVGVGEAGCVPASLSLIARNFSRDERPRAVSLYLQGVSASFLIGYFFGGWLDEAVGWRLTFVLIGFPGLGLALLACGTIKEKPGGEPELEAAGPPAASFREVCAFLWKCKAFCNVLSSLAVSWFFTYGTLQWTPAFFSRSFGLRTGELGGWLAVIYGFTSIIGTYVGGEWAARRAARNEQRQLKVMALLTVISGVFAALIYIPATAPNYYLAFIWLALSTLISSMTSGPPFSAIQALTPPRMRAVAVAIVYLVGNLIGMGFGPWAAGAASDALRPWVDNESLRYAMLLLCPGFLWSAWHLWAAAKTVSIEVERVCGIEQDGQQYVTPSRPHPSVVL